MEVAAEFKSPADTAQCVGVAFFKRDWGKRMPRHLKPDPLPRRACILRSDVYGPRFSSFALFTPIPHAHSPSPSFLECTLSRFLCPPVGLQSGLLFSGSPIPFRALFLPDPEFIVAALLSVFLSLALSLYLVFLTLHCFRNKRVMRHSFKKQKKGANGTNSRISKPQG